MKLMELLFPNEPILKVARQPQPDISVADVVDTHEKKQ
jgi:hypothetical protein